MNENPYASPEAVVEIADARLSPYLRRLERLRMGMSRFAWAGAAEVGAALLMTQKDAMSVITGFCLLMTACTLQIMGTFRCMACPSDIVYGGPWRLMLGWGLCIAGCWMIIGDYGDRYELYGVACIAVSRLTWLWFLLSASAGLKNRRAWWLTLAAVWLWLVAGMGMSMVIYVDSLDDRLLAGKEWLETLHAVFYVVSPLAWIAFIGLYLALLADLRGWLGELVKMKSEGESHE